MTNYSEHISEELARKLLDWGYPLLSYAPGTYDGAPCFDIPGPDEPGWADGDRYQIPTYGEVFDWFSRVKGIVITLEPFHTFALKGQIGYTWKINYVDPEFGLVLRTEENEYQATIKENKEEFNISNYTENTSLEEVLAIIKQ